MMAAAGDVKTGAMAVRADQGDFYYKKRCVCVCVQSGRAFCGRHYLSVGDGQRSPTRSTHLQTFSLQTI